MRIPKLFAITGLLVVLILASPATSIPFKQNNPTGNPAVATKDSAIGVTTHQFNASITNVARNMTVYQNSRILLQDIITLNVGANTSIYTLNYTLPSVFAQYILAARFFVQRDTSLGIATNNNNTRTANAFYGDQVTLFQIDVRDNQGNPANSSSTTYIEASFDAYGALQNSVVSGAQRSYFMAPVIPTFYNLPVNNSLIGIVLSGNDQFQASAMDHFSQAGQSYPIVHTPTMLEWINMTRVPFDPIVGYRNTYDYAKVVFDSLPISTSAPAIIPYIFTNAQRVVRIDPWGFVYVTETLTIEHTGATRALNGSNIATGYELSGYALTVQSTAKITDVYDQFGRLNLGARSSSTNFPNTRLGNNNNKHILDVAFRNPLFGGESYTFSVDYRYNISDVISIKNGLHVLNASLFSDFNTTVKHMDVNFELPSGASLRSINYDARSWKTSETLHTYVNHNAISFFDGVGINIHLDNAAPIDNYVFTISYTFGLSGYFGYIATLFLFFVLLFSILSVVRYISFTPATAIEIEKEQIPLEEIKSFLDLFKERQSAEKTIVDLGEQYRLKKIKKVDYDGKVKAIRRRIENKRSDLDKASQRLAKKGTHFSNLVDKAVLSHERQQDINRAIIDARKRYKSNRLSKDVYTKTRLDYKRETDKLETEISKALSSLTDYIHS